MDQVEQPAKQKLATFVVTPLFRRSLDIIHQSPFLVIPGDYVKYMSLKEKPREVSVPSKLTYDGTLQHKLMMININNGRDRFFLLFRVAENYWYLYDGMASEPARRLLLLPSSVSSVISVVIYICFSLLRVTNGSELTSEDDNLVPKIDETSSKKRKPCSTINVESDEEKLKKKPTRKDSKACSTDPSDEETLNKNLAKKDSKAC